jgi:pantothenate kinase-related protein Tda10
VLDGLRRINTSKATVHLPVYDKSLHSGLGDRASETVAVEGPIDVVIFEGWMLGFYPIPESALRARYETPTSTLPGSDHAPLGKDHLRGPFFARHSLESLAAVNSFLAAYSEKLWPAIGAFIQMEPLDMAFTWEWRLQVRGAGNRGAHGVSAYESPEQQEHNMKAKNGGIGMTDDEVEAFVARYVQGIGTFVSVADCHPQVHAGIRVVRRRCDPRIQGRALASVARSRSTARARPRPQCCQSRRALKRDGSKMSSATDSMGHCALLMLLSKRKGCQKTL